MKTLVLTMTVVLALAGAVNAGEIIAWGNDGFGEISNVPAGNDFVQVSMGDTDAVALRADGTVVGWGRNHFNQNGSLPTTGGWAEVHAGGGANHILLHSDGHIESFGDNNYGFLDDTPTGSDFIDIYGGYYMAAALRSDGSIVSWGRGTPPAYYGDTLVATNPTGTGHSSPTVGQFGAIAINSTGSLITWGLNGAGELNVPAGLWSSVDVGMWRTGIGIRALDGSLDVWGATGDGQLSEMPAGTGYLEALSGQTHCAALAADGSVEVWGNDAMSVGMPTGSGYIDLDCGYYSTAVITPEPGTICLLSLGVVGLLRRRRA